MIQVLMPRPQEACSLHWDNLGTPKPTCHDKAQDKRVQESKASAPVSSLHIS